MKDAYTEEYGKYSKYIARRYSYQKRFNAVKQFLEENKCIDVLDIGSATGDYAIDLSRADFKLTCVDINPKHLEVLKEKDNSINVFEADAKSLPFKKRSFDAILILNAFRMFRYPNLSLRECNRVLKDNGNIIIIEHNRYCPDTLLIKQNDVFHYYSPGELEKILDENYFRIINKELMFIPPPSFNAELTNSSSNIAGKLAFLLKNVFPELIIHARKRS